jgi:phenylalanyl-tRNA synthetase beta chain
VDVSREADLIEEVARHLGYDRLPATFPALASAPARPDARLEREHLARRVALGAGFSESVTFTFIERAAALHYADESSFVPLANPLSEKYAVMRPTLLPGLVDSMSHNRRRERRDVQLFEIGARFTCDAGEGRSIAFAWTGGARPLHWSAPSRAVDFYDIKGAVEAVTDAFGLAATFDAATHPALVAGRAARVTAHPANGAPVLAGFVGQLAAALADAHGLPPQDEVYVAEIDLDAIGPVADLRDHFRVQPLPRHPSNTRDLSILAATSVPAATLRRTIREAAPPTLDRVTEFARYEGKGVPDGMVSLSFRLVFRAADRTLPDAEVQAAVDEIVAALGATHDARLR